MNTNSRHAPTDIQQLFSISYVVLQSEEERLAARPSHIVLLDELRELHPERVLFTRVIVFDRLFSRQSPQVPLLQISDTQTVHRWVDEYIVMGGPAQDELDAVWFINQYRISQGLQPLRYTDETMALARAIATYGNGNRAIFSICWFSHFFFQENFRNLAGCLNYSRVFTGDAGFISRDDLSGIEAVVRHLSRSPISPPVNPDAVYVGLGTYGNIGHILIISPF